jgi:hypothetical protein
VVFIAADGEAQDEVGVLGESHSSWGSLLITLSARSKRVPAVFSEKDFFFFVKDKAGRFC